MKHIPAILCALALLLGASEYASAREPLLVPGKTTLFQRVISHPGTVSYKSPNAEITGVVDSFTPLYVYDKKIVNGEEWLEVSPSSGASSTQWIRSLNGSRWNKALSLVFTERMGRDPVMFFRSYDGLNQLITSEKLSDELTRLVREYRHDTLDASSPLIALEPKASAVPREQFYGLSEFSPRRMAIFLTVSSTTSWRRAEQEAFTWSPNPAIRCPCVRILHRTGKR